MCPSSHWVDESSNAFGGAVWGILVDNCREGLNIAAEQVAVVWEPWKLRNLIVTV